jgi:hypothetical protein
LVFLLATVTLGLSFRWQLAGANIRFLGGLDLRRAHSHLAFYGVVFPAVWYIGVGEGLFAARRKLLLAYFLAVGVSAVGFLVQSYGPVSIAGSTVVLFVWLVFAADLIRSETNPFLRLVPIFIFLSAIAIGFVAVLSKRNPLVADQIAHSFLGCLLLGVLAPTCLSALRSSQGLRTPSLATGAAWATAAFISAVSIPGLVDGWAMGAGSLALGAMIIHGSLSIDRKDRAFRLRRLVFYWALFGAALVLTGVGLLRTTHLFAIAGIHFLVLAPILLTVAELKGSDSSRSAFARIPYEIAVGVMCAAIALQDLFPRFSFGFQRLAAWSGTVVVFSMIIAGGAGLYGSTRARLGHRRLARSVERRSDLHEQRLDRSR